MSMAALSRSAIRLEPAARASWLRCCTSSNDGTSSAALPPSASVAATPWLLQSSVSDFFRPLPCVAALSNEPRSFGRWSKRRRLGRLAQFVGAVGAVVVCLGDFVLAVRAARMQVAFAVGTEIEARADRLAATRAGIRQRFTNQEVNDETDAHIAGREHQHQQRPQQRVHAPTLG